MSNYFVNDYFNLCLNLDTSSSRTTILNNIQDFLRKHFQANGTGLYIIKEKKIELLPWSIGRFGKRLSPNKKLIERVKEEEKFLFKPIDEDFTLLRELEAENELKNLMLIPLYSEKEFYGLLFVYFEKLFLLDDTISRAMEVLARFISIILSNKFLYNKMEQRLAELLTLQTVSDFVNSTLDFEKLIDITLDAIVGLIGLRTCSITIFIDKLFDDIFSRQQKALIASVESTEEIEIDLNKGIYGELSRTRSPISGFVTADDELLSLITSKRFKQDLEFQYIILPVARGNELFGSINIFDPTLDHIQNIEKYFLESFTNQFSVALQNAKLYRKQSEMARKDGLTNLYNHAYFQNKLTTLIEKKSKLPLSMILIDIDDFKMVNDKHGHLTGDNVLKTLSKILRQYTRDGDLVARYGGEEFAILLPKTSEKKAVELAKRLRKIIEKSCIDIDSTNKLSITVSMGVAEYMLGWTKEYFINRVDQLLYKAKNNGKNRVEFAE
jgi:diguanylate cyclase (GGDEF)-like protein